MTEPFKKHSQASVVVRRVNCNHRDEEDNDDCAVISGTSSSPSSYQPTPLPSDDTEDELISIDFQDDSTSDENDSDDRISDDDDSDDSLYSVDDNEEDEALLVAFIPFDEPEDEETLAFNNDAGDRLRTGNLRPSRSYLHHRHQTRRWNGARPQVEARQGAVMLQPQQIEDLINNLAQIDNDSDDFSILLQAIHYTTVPAAIHALPMTFLILSCTLIPPAADLDFETPRTVASVLCSSFGVFGTSAAIFNFARRSDFRVARGIILNHQMEKYIIQLLSVTFVTPFLFSIQAFRLFEPAKAYRNDLPIFDPWYFLTLKCFLFSFVTFFTLDIPLSLHRMVQGNPVFCEILTFELVAHLLPTAYIAAPFILMDLLAVFIIPPAWQSIWLWLLIHLVACSWIGLIILGLIMYPEITVQRRYGIPGYGHMGMVIMIQCLLAMVYIVFLWLVRLLSVGVISSLGFDSMFLISKDAGGVGQYLLQINGDVPSDEWRYQYPYPITFDFFMLISYMVCQLRILNLIILQYGYDDRIENAQEIM